MFLSILTWYLALQCFAVVGLPLAFAALHRLPSRGYAMAKSLGLLLTGVVFWWGGTVHLWPNTGSAIITSAVIVLSVGLLLMRGQWAEAQAWWRIHRRHVLVVEGLFALAMVSWALVRATQPQLQTAGGEKWMEIAYLHAALRSPSMPPHDPWLSGFAISYYYLGYLLLALVTRVTQIPPTIAFNLANAGWFALVAIQAYSIVYDMLPRQRADREPQEPIWRPLVAPIMLLITGNGVGLLEVLHARGLLPASFWRWLDIGRLSEAPQPPYSWRPQRFFWWWQASRTIRDITPWGDAQEVIDEFPAFSFILGDMHPHLLALPFVLVAITLALHAYLLARDAGPSSGERERGPWLRLAGYAVVLGALGFLNTWDFPIYWALLVGAWIVGRYAHTEPSVSLPTRLRAFFGEVWQTLPEAIALALLSVIFYLPFWVALRSQAGGILPNLFNATKLHQFVVMFLPLMIPITGLVLAGAWRRSVRWYRALGLGIGLMPALALVGLVIGVVAAYPYLNVILQGEMVAGHTLTPEMAIAAVRRRLTNPWTGLLLAVGVGTVLVSLIGGDRHEAVDDTSSPPDRQVSSDAFPLLLALLGLLLTLAPEFVYLQDVFMTRMNTIFKFYFQAWVLWSLAGAWQICRWLGRPAGENTPSTWRFLGLMTSTLLIGVGLIYTVLAIPARGEEQGMPWTLDGAAWLAASYPEDDAAIMWLNTHVEGAPVIVEAPGDQHRAYVYEGRVSALTGLPTVLGWGGHERQWRGNYDEPARREADLELLFTAQDESEMRTILTRYDVAYLYVGPIERRRYPADTLARFRELFPAVYDDNGVVIYRVSTGTSN